MNETQEINQTESPFGPVIYSYTRKQALDYGEWQKLFKTGWRTI